jgi:branched-chain amino acid transport system substrate-binding protein
MKRAFHRVFVLGLAATVSLTSACGSDGGSGADSGGSSKPYSVLVILAMSGPLGTQSAAESLALQAAADKINAAGGVLGRQMKLTVKDDQGDPTKAVGFVQSTLTGDSKPDLVIAGTTSNESRAIVPLLTKSKIVSISEAGALDLVDPKKSPYGFSSSATNTATAAALTGIVQKKAPKKVGILSTSDALGKSLSATYQKTFSAAGIPFVADSFDVAAVDVTANLQRLQSGGVDYLVFSGFGAPAGHVLEARAKLNWNVPTLGDAAVGATPIKTLVPATALTGVEYLANAPTVFSSSVKPELQSLIDVIKAKGGFTQPLQVYTYSYDSLWAMKVAAEQAKSAEGPQVAKALESLQQPNPTPFLSFSSLTYSNSAADGHGVQAKPADFVNVPASAEIVDGLIRTNH